MSACVRLYKHLEGDSALAFFIGGDEPHEATEWVTRHALDHLAGPRGRKPHLYYEIPGTHYQLVLNTGIERVKMSEFDRRTCQQGSGIPTVQHQIEFSE
jgi:hypothetical protein